MKYKCIACDYSTDDRRNWHSHTHSKKHIGYNKNKNVTRDDINEMMDNKLLKCMF